MQKIKLVALDLDETLLNKSRAVSPRAKAAIAAARADGVAVTVATGRMYVSAAPYARQLEIDLPIITYNGALIKNSISGDVLYHRPLEPQTAAEVLAVCRDRGWYVQSYIDDVLYVAERNSHARYYEAIAGVKAVPMGGKLYSLPGAPTKLMVIAEDERLPDIQAVLAEHFGDGIYLAKSQSRFLEITHPTVNKGRALAFLAESLGIGREQVMAIGDSANDIDMLSYAGWGVAMGNAAAAVKAVADAVTETDRKSVV